MSRDIFAEIFKWSAELTPWQNEVIRRLFQTGSLSVQDKAEVLDMLLIEVGLWPAPAKNLDRTLRESELPSPPAPGERVKLKGLRELKNVNALRGDRLAVGENLTIVFGENASGKSGYARVMKRAFRARAVEPILQNVYEEQKVMIPASAIFEIEESATTRDEVWVDGKPTSACLGRFSVFDSKCARVYVNDSNELDFVPYGFDVIHGLGDFTAEAKKRLQDIATTSKPKSDALKLLIDQTPTGRFLASLSAETEVDELNSRAIWTESDQQSLESKSSELETAKSNSPQSLRERLSAHRKAVVAIKSEINRVHSELSDEKVIAMKRASEECLKYEQAVRVSAQLEFGDQEISGIGSDAWRAMLLAAENFATQVAFPGVRYPSDSLDAKCVLCLQNLGPSARERQSLFWKFVRDDNAAKRDVVEAQLATAKRDLSNLPKDLPRHIEVLEEVLSASGSTVYKIAQDYFNHFTARLACIESALASGDWNTITIAPDTASPICDAEVAAIDKKLGEIDDDRVAEAILRTLVEEVAELNSRKKLSDNRTVVTSYLDALKFASMAGAAASKITTNGISLKASELQKKYVTEGFRNAVKAELEPFHLPRLRASVEKRSDKGKVLHFVVLEGPQNAVPETVLSEGERLAVALACFMAELAIGDDNCGIVLDDPMSSLDHNVRTAVVKRLVDEAQKRQVVVFTHDLVVYRELLAEAKAQQVQVTTQSVVALGTTVGILVSDPPLDAMRVGPRMQVLDRLLKSAKDAEAKADITAYRSVYREFYDLLRSTWEKSVEEIMFNRVVERLEKEVKTRSLDGVMIDEDSVKAVFKGMKRTSEMIDAHNHATAANTSLGSSDALAADLNSLKQFVADQTGKSKKAESALKHLK